MSAANGSNAQAQKTSNWKLLQEERKNLPIASAEGKLVDAIKSNGSLIIIGETGSGKTTQIPQFLHSAGLSKHGCIAVTEPRRVAAVSVARRVSQEMGCQIGHEVGYAVRFEDVTTNRTCVKFLTDGMLLREALLDPLLKKYSVVIVDEAHERTVSTDVLFGLLKQVQAKRATSYKTNNSSLPSLKLVVMSATLHTEQFQAYFEAPAVYIQGRQYPVQVFYTEEPESDYLDAAVTTVLQVHESEPAGSILVFLPGQEEIETAERLLTDRMASLGKSGSLGPLETVAMFANMPSEQQMRAFEPAKPGHRKVILATNIAETSVTIPGVKYVVDPGLVKAKTFSAKLGMEALLLVPVSKAQARQRTGRAGRESAGKCFRLFTEATFDSLEENTVPEIKRCNPTSIVLQLKAMGIHDILGFGFMDRPPRLSLLKALEHLYHLGALTKTGDLSPEGVQMARFPMEPILSKALLVAAKSECLEEMSSLIAMLTVESIFFSPREKQEQARAAKARFVSTFGDQLTLVRVFRSFRLESSRKVAAVKSWCSHNFLNYRSLSKAIEVYRQVKGYCEGLGMELKSCGEDWTAFRKCLASSFFLNAARKQPDNTYRALANGQTVAIHPSSVMQGKKPECVIYNEIVKTNKQYIRDVTEIEPQWLIEFAPHFYRVHGK